MTIDDKLGELNGERNKTTHGIFFDGLLRCHIAICRVKDQHKKDALLQKLDAINTLFKGSDVTE